MPEVVVEQENVHVVFVVRDDAGNEYRDAFVMPEDDYRALDKDGFEKLALERWQAHTEHVERSANAPGPSPDEAVQRVAALDAERARIEQERTAMMAVAFGEDAKLPRAERRRLARQMLKG